MKCRLVSKLYSNHLIRNGQIIKTNLKFKSTYHSYASTNAFSKLVLDYLADEPNLKDFYTHQPTKEGVEEAIKIRKKNKINRSLLVDEMKKSYQAVPLHEKVSDNINALANENTFTVCTAHQPNIFTGHLYFIYKIIHAIKLADELNKNTTGLHFVPVYYMGSEDADLNELGEIMLNGKQYRWETNQKGAVGRMKVDKLFITLIDRLSIELLASPYGEELVKIIRVAYVEGVTIERATLNLVNELFGKFGLLIFLSDNKAFKKEFKAVIEDELFNQFSNKLVNETIDLFPKEFTIQAKGRLINLFYLKDNIRERIEQSDSGYSIVDKDIHFSREEIKAEIDSHPERFSPNVILRPLFQEMMLPNVAFVGGGGELAYWLELKSIFSQKQVPYPVLFLRNSFLIIEKKYTQALEKFSLSPIDLFEHENILIDKVLARFSKNELLLSAEKIRLKELYYDINKKAAIIDKSLVMHVEALFAKSVKKIEALEKKIKKAEKRKFESEINELIELKQALFPDDTLQERKENILQYYNQFGTSFIDELYTLSKVMDHEFCIMSEV